MFSPLAQTVHGTRWMRYALRRYHGALPRTTMHGAHFSRHGPQHAHHQNTTKTSLVRAPNGDLQRGALRATHNWRVGTAMTRHVRWRDIQIYSLVAKCSTIVIICAVHLVPLLLMSLLVLGPLLLATSPLSRA